MKSYAVYGASGCGRGVMPLVRQQLQLLLQSGDVDLVFVDDKPLGAMVNGQRVLTYAQWMAEPAQNSRVRIGVWVLLFLAGFTFIAWRLNAAYWKDIK